MVVESAVAKVGGLNTGYGRWGYLVVAALSPCTMDIKELLLAIRRGCEISEATTEGDIYRATAIAFVGHVSGRGPVVAPISGAAFIDK